MKEPFIKQSKRCIDPWLVVPYKDTKAGINSLLAYFQYEAPNESSIHSSAINDSLHDSIIDSILKATPFLTSDFCKQQKSVSKKLKDSYLFGNMIYLKHSRFVCYQRPKQHGNEVESRLLCFLKHIRNSIAHGRLYVSKDTKNPYILFEDMKDQAVSARILCRKEDLETWKNILMAVH